MLKNNLYPIKVYDDLVPKEIRLKIWNYLQQQTWHVKWRTMPVIPEQIKRYKPAEGQTWLTQPVVIPSCGTFHRCCLAVDENHLKEKHPMIMALWNIINKSLNNEYEITGTPEDTADTDYDATMPADFNGDRKGWRVYVNGQYGNAAQGRWGSHRDTPNLEDETSVTIIYVATIDWYPRYGAELVYFPEDPDGVTRDHQQFAGNHQQQRNYNIGWADQGRMISPVPGRVIVQDGRALHSTNQPDNYITGTPMWKVIFRARRKTPWPETD
jgi:hypothetical protein